MKGRGRAVIGALLAVSVCSQAAIAQDSALTAANGGGAPRILADSASPFGKPEAAELDPASVKMPELAFTPSPTDAEDFDKYYYFHRDSTDFATAYADLRECDGYASGLSSGIDYTGVPYPYTGTMAGALGGAIGSALAVAIFGSAEKRKARRVNMRLCMFYKGYQRFGLPKSLWTEFNFEEGIGHVGHERRVELLKRQALVAAQATPKGEALGL
ncbi:hypothetical protein [Sphingomonas elodea]|uniref:hypothetical protein n=1 Tax=Sphingomonas elodea TaxID=179878 RepID=UPI0002631D81|nr:hypothetical protein [Sphingomonas elodea]